MEHAETIRKAFGKQAANFGDQGLTLSSQEYLTWVVEILPLQADFRVLDVAAGTGHLSRALAPRVRQVVALDLTSAMLAEARKEALRAGLTNLRFAEGEAGTLPYRDDAFDLVVSRLAVHHFPEPDRPIREMVRVCKPGHAVGVIDLLSPAEDTLQAPYNRLERLRDPSHTVALTHAQLLAGLEMAGLRVTRTDTRDVSVNFQRWVGMTGVDQPTIDVIQRALETDLAGGDRTGMRPYIHGGTLHFLQRWAVVLAAKPAGPPAAGDTVRRHAGSAASDPRGSV